MKNILITGANSYVGTSFEKWLSQWPDRYHVDTVDMIDSAWREKSLAEYDVIFHVAGIAHRKETKQNAHVYYEVNRDLAIETARKAKADGVHQFIFMSSMSVYGLETGVITQDTVPNPKSHYGKSKLEAEQGITALENESFRAAILRPPMIYGKGCTGNYKRLRAFVLKYRIFPNIANKRSMIQMNNLCAYVQKCIDGYVNGLFFPQDPEYICTRDMAVKIGECSGEKVTVSPLFNIVKLFGGVAAVKKVFGDLYYQDIDEWSRCGVSFPETIIVTEN